MHRRPAGRLCAGGLGSFRVDESLFGNGASLRTDTATIMYTLNPKPLSANTSQHTGLPKKLRG